MLLHPLYACSRCAEHRLRYNKRLAYFSERRSEGPPPQSTKAAPKLNEWIALKCLTIHINTVILTLQYPETNWLLTDFNRIKHQEPNKESVFKLSTSGKHLCLACGPTRLHREPQIIRFCPQGNRITRSTKARSGNCALDPPKKKLFDFSPQPFTTCPNAPASRRRIRN